MRIRRIGRGSPVWRHAVSETRMERLLEVSAYRLYLSCLGNTAPDARVLYGRMINPQVGDVVMEISTIHHDGQRPRYESRTGDRIGTLMRIESEPMHTPEQWAEGGYGDEPIPTERAWYLRLLDGREYRWVNASFIALPSDLDCWRAL
jgi:hypothetical protein